MGDQGWSRRAVPQGADVHRTRGTAIVSAMASEQPATEGGQPQLSYEQARDELVAIVSKLETGGTTLEESLALWERGEELAALCERYLDNARARLEAADANRAEG